MIISPVSQGLSRGIFGLGIYLTFRILSFPGMTTEGSFPLGGAMAIILMNHGSHPILTTLAGMLTGCFAGLVAGLLYTKGKIPTILAGILVVTFCNSIMLMIMKRANFGLLDVKTLQDLFPFADSTDLLIIGLLTVAIVISGLTFFLYTRLGQAYIATGNNHGMVKSFGINTDRMEVMGLTISNGLIASSGTLVSQQDGCVNISEGVGAIVIGLANIIIGEALYSTGLILLERLIAIAVGSILYQFLITAVIALGFNTNCLKLFSTPVLALCLTAPVLKDKFFKGVTLSR